MQGRLSLWMRKKLVLQVVVPWFAVQDEDCKTGVDLDINFAHLFLPRRMVL